MKFNIVVPAMGIAAPTHDLHGCRKCNGIVWNNPCPCSRRHTVHPLASPLLCIPAAAAYSTSFGIAAPLHPCSRGIQYILYIKKPPEKGAYM